jgi:PAS domain S-box-containing protein
LAEKLHNQVPLIVLVLGSAASLLLFLIARWSIEVRRNEQRFRDYANLGSDWLWEQDADLRFTYVSERGVQAAGADLKEVLGHTRHDVFGRTNRGMLSAEAWDSHLKVLADRQPFRNFEVPTISPTGEIRYLLSNGVPVYDEGGRFRGYRGIGRDVTEERRRARELQTAKEEAEAASHSKSEFLAHMSHELRTPLNAVLGFSEIIRDQHFGKSGQAKYIEYAGDIYKSGRHLLSLVDDVLDMSRIEAGRYELHEEPIELGAIFDAAMSMLMPRAIDGRVLVRTRFDPALPKIRGDMRSLKQVVINLISNAIKFTEPGGSVTVSAALDQEGGMDVTIADTGIGIPSEHIDAVFEPFHQVENVRTRRQMGTGLGLAISRSFMQLHGGTIKLDSVLGRGTTATVHIPAARVLSS